MQYIPFKNQRFSQLILGTVQLGIDYGISNVTGQPSLSQGLNLIRLASDQGINTFDTARAYGSAEKVIAEAGKQMSAQKSNLIITKFRIDPEHESDLDNSWTEAFTSVRGSLEALGRQRVCAALFHRSPFNNLNKVIKILPTIIGRLKEMNLIEFGGLSAHYPDDVRYAINEEELELIQVSCNLFDHRLLHVASAKELENKLVIARSIFLQGLFFLDTDQLSPKMKAARRHLVRLRKITSDYGVTLAQLAVGFVRDLPHVDCVVIGAINKDQVVENVKLIRQPAMLNTIRSEIMEIFSEVDDFIITPALWSH